MSRSLPGRSISQTEFEDALLYSFLGWIAARLTRRSADLLPLQALVERIQVRGQHQRGLQSVPLDRIVGSEGRSADFDRNFRPRTRHTRDRWKRIVDAHLAGYSLPPVDLLKVGEIYFVRDGNHRISVARRLGQFEIDANVFELTTDTTLTPDLVVADLPYVEEQSDFMEWTQLADVGCATPIRVTQLGGYLDLIHDINRHRQQLSAERVAPIEREEAVADWYLTVYQPVVTLLANHELRPGRAGPTEGDLFLAVLRHRREIESAGCAPTLLEAATSYAALHRPRRGWRFGRN